MTTIDLDNTLYKIDLVASFNNATEINTLKNTFSVFTISFAVYVPSIIVKLKLDAPIEPLKTTSFC